MAKQIIDISSNNGHIDWNEVVNDGVTDVIIRLSLGFGDKDQMAEKYAAEAKSVGLKISYYHLAYPDTKQGSITDDASKEANYFTSHFIAGQMPSPRWLAIDLEKMSSGWDTPLNKTDYLKWVQIFISQVYANTGITCLIYSNKSYLEEHLPSNHPLGSIPLWIANYNNVIAPPLPNGWAQFFMWQYSSKGLIRGIKGNVDLNVLKQDNFVEKLVKKFEIQKTIIPKFPHEEKSLQSNFLTKLTLDQIYVKINENNKSNFSKELIAAICWAESSFKPDSVATGSSSKGLMMVNKGAVDTVNANTPSGTHYYYDDMLNPDLAIACGTWYLKILFTKNDWQCKGDIRKTLTVFRHGKVGTDFKYADKITTCESCLKSTIVIDKQTCLNQIHP
jgi:lysozyme